MLKRALIPCLLIATFATLPALATGPDVRVTHSERITASEARPLRVSALDSGIPQTWCGTKTSTDQTVNSVSDENPKFKFIYARTADRPDRFDAAANFIQKSVATVHGYLLGVSGGTRTISIDLGTSCGPMYVDLMALTLPGSASDYQDIDGEVDSNTVITAIDTLVKYLPGPPRHYVAILDQLQPAGSIRGAAYQALDDSPGPGNANNLKGLAGFVATPEGALDQPVNSEFPRAMLHEMAHTMGAVQSSAPNQTSAGHCTDGLDIMCYDDGSPEAAGYSEGVCTTGGAAGINYSFDCNNDDYFNTNPAPGSYLATKWNVFDSKYLLKCVDADPYCTSVPSSKPTADNPAARTAKNTLSLYKYKSGSKSKKRVKDVGTVTAIGAKEVGLPFVRNSVSMGTLKLPKGKWKVTVCFRESGAKSVCKSSTKSTSKSGKLSVGKIYVTSSTGAPGAYGSVVAKPVTKSLKKKGYEVRTTKSPIKYSLAF